MKAKKAIIITLIVIVVLGAGGFYVYNSGIMGTNDSELQIDQTPNVVNSIKKISEFVTMNYYDEFIISDEKTTEAVDNSFGRAVAGLFGKKDKALMKDQLVIIAKGCVRAGFDLSKVQEGDVSMSGDTLMLRLPAAEVLDATINPSGFDVFIEDGTWSHEQVSKVEEKAIKQLEQRALTAGILEKAEKNGIEQMTNMYKAFGFKEVVCMIGE